MPITCWTFAAGGLALSGIFPFAGFWSKDEIVFVAGEARHGTGPAPGWLGWIVWLAALVTVVVTAWYATRLWLRTFFGAPRGLAAEHPHEPPWPMRAPVVVLAVPSALLGFVAFVPGFGRALGGTGSTLVNLGPEALLPLACLALGAGGAWLVWRRDPEADPARALGPARTVFAEAFYLDAVQDALVVRPVTALARTVRRTDESIVDGAVEGTGAGTLGLGGLLARAHRATLPAAATAVLAGAILLGVAAVVLGVGR
jgi:NADH-quinone oxidoreductase subunit L